MSVTLDRIEREIASEVLDVILSEALALAPAAEHTDECMAFVHAIVRNSHIRYGALPLQNMNDQRIAAFGARGGLSATPLTTVEYGNGRPN